MLGIFGLFLQAAAGHILYLALHLESGSFPRPLPPADDPRVFLLAAHHIQRDHHDMLRDGYAVGARRVAEHRALLGKSAGCHKLVDAGRGCALPAQTRRGFCQIRGGTEDDLGLPDEIRRLIYA